MILNGIKKTNKTKLLTTLVVSFVVFFGTLFALAENKNSNSLFLDSDQDGLTDQEERMLGTDFQKADTDNDGYSDGKEVQSGFNPLKPAPGDKIVVSAGTSSASPAKKSESSQPTDDGAKTDSSNPEDLLTGSGSDLAILSGTGFEGLTEDALTNLDSDPDNPNLTNEMLGQLMQLTNEKAASSENFLTDPTFTAEDYSQIAQKSLEKVDITQDLPEIKDSELKILPPVDDKKLKPEKVKEKQKEEIEKYLAQTAFVMASNSPFPVENPSDLGSNLNAEGTSLVNALASGDQMKISSYAEKAQTGIDQMKNIEVPYVLKDAHKSMLQLALYTLDLKDSLTLNTEDPMKSLVAASSLEAVTESAMKLQGEFSKILSDYGVEFVNFP